MGAEIAVAPYPAGGKLICLGIILNQSLLHNFLFIMVKIFVCLFGEDLVNNVQYKSTFDL